MGGSGSHEQESDHRMDRTQSRRPHPRAPKHVGLPFLHVASRGCLRTASDQPLEAAAESVWPGPRRVGVVIVTFDRASVDPPSSP